MSDYLTVHDSPSPAALAGIALGIVLGCSAVSTAPTTPRPTATSTPAAAGIELPAEHRSVDPGTYALTSAGFRYILTVSGHEWLSLGPDFGVIQGDDDNDPPDQAALAVWVDAKFVYLNPCQWTGTEATTGSSPQEWVDAIGQLEELNPSEPTDVLVGGHVGKRITITVDDDVDTSLCVGGEYRPYEGRIHIGATQTDEIWIVSLPGGQRGVIVTTYFPDTPDQLIDELEQMVASMTIERE